MWFYPEHFQNRDLYFIYSGVLPFLLTIRIGVRIFNGTSGNQKLIQTAVRSMQDFLLLPSICYLFYIHMRKEVSSKYF